MAKAREIMTPNPLMLGSGTDLNDAVEFFNKYKVSSAPVQNPLGEVLGQLTEFDLVKAVVRCRADSNYCKVIHAEEFFEPVFFVNEGDEIPIVLRMMMKSPTHRVLVKDVKGKIIGIISPKDLLRSIHGDKTVGSKVADEVKALQRELDELRTRLNEMTSYLQTYDVVFQSGLFGLHSADKDGKIIFANERLHEMLGYPPGDLIGKSIFDLYAPEVRGEAREGLKTVMTEGKHSLVYSLMVKPSGQTVQVDLASAAMRDERGRFIGTFTISRAHGSAAMEVHLPEIFPAQPNKASS